MWNNRGAGGSWDFFPGSYCLSDPSAASHPVVRALRAEGKLLRKAKVCGWAKKKKSLGALCSLNFWDFINTSPCFLQHCRNPGFGECRGSLNLLHFRRNFSSFMQGKWHIISNVNVIIKSNYFTILLPSLDIVFAIIAVINHMVSINSLTTWGQIIPAGGIDDFQVWRCHAESHHPGEWHGFGSLSPLTDEQEGKISDASHSWVGSEDVKAPHMCFGQKSIFVCYLCLLLFHVSSPWLG